MRQYMQLFRDWLAQSSGNYDDLVEEYTAGFMDALQELEIDLEDLTDAELDKINRAYKEVANIAIDDVTNKLLESWKTQAKIRLIKERRYRKGFERRLSRLWGDAISKLETMQSICLGLGAAITQKYGEIAAKEEDNKFAALVRLHAHACMVVSEIIALLKSGFPNGALSRWRTLYEIVVIANFILQNEQETALKFLHHDEVISYHMAVEYNEVFEHHGELLESRGHKPFDQDTMQQLEDGLTELCGIYGEVYGNRNYGWAADELDTDYPSFRKIDKAVDISTMRPYYVWACQFVHATPKGILHTLGQSPAYEEIPIFEQPMIAGSSFFGLADPGQNTAIALNQITAALLSLKAGPTEVIEIKAMGIYCEEVIQAFIGVLDVIEKKNAVMN